MKNLTGYASIDKPQNIGYSYFKTHPIIPNMNIYLAIYYLSLFYRTDIAIDCKEISVNYGGMLDDAKTISLALKELGVKKGDIISVKMPNFYHAVATFLAANRIGAVTTFLNYHASNSEIKHYLNLFESSIFINYGYSKEENENIIKDTLVKHSITLNKHHNNDTDLNSDYRITSTDNLIDFNSLGSIAAFQKNELEPFHFSNEDALILFTSGTTGKPKPVVLTNKNVLASGTYLKNSSNIKSNKIDSRTLVCVPFTYPYGFGTSTLMTLMSGKTAILGPDISAETLEYYLRKQPNIIFGSPAFLELIKRNTPKDMDLSFIREFISGGDFLTESANKEGVQFFKTHNANVTIGNGSGNAETMSSGTNPVGVKSRPETAGKILVGTEAIIVDTDNLKEKKYKDIGTLLVRGEHVFKCYYKNPDLTKGAFITINGKKYFNTGTLGFIDEEGYFTLTGRESRFYIESSLNKIYLDRVQLLLSEIDCIEDCAVVKTPDDKRLSVNTAYIVLKEKYKNQDLDSIKEFILSTCKNILPSGEQLKDYEIPTYIEFLDELPRKQGTEKIDYNLLEEHSKDNQNNIKKLTLNKI